jgi:UPF0716 protein FxsA
VALVLLIAVVGVPILEIYVALQVAHQIGWLATVALLVLLAASGPWIVRRQGLGIWRRAQQRARAGDVPGREMMDGILLLAAGVLLTLPGFVTAAFGILLLLPPVRALLRGAAGAWFVRQARAGRISVGVYSDGRWGGLGGPRQRPEDTPIDAGTHEAPEHRPDRPDVEGSRRSLPPGEDN